MARRKAANNDPRILAVFFLIFLLVFATFAIAAWILCVWLFREMVYGRRIAALGENLNYTDSELAQIEQLQEDQDRLVAERDVILAEGRDVATRQDGYFSERSQLGKSLNARLIPVVEEGKKAKAGLMHYSMQLAERCSQWNELRAKRLSSRVGVLCMGLVATPVLLLEPTWAVDFGTWIIEHGTKFLPVLDPIIYSTLIVSTWAAFVAYYAAKLAEAED